MKKDISKILFITLSNIGDCILTLPALDAVIGAYPGAKITVMAGPRPREIFENNPRIAKVIVYDKHSRLKDKARLFRELRIENFDLVVDLRDTFLGACLNVKKCLSFLRVWQAQPQHMLGKHLLRSGLAYNGENKEALHITRQDELLVERLLSREGVSPGDKIIAVASGARSHIKRWDKDKFAELVNLIAREFSVKVVIVGDKDDTAVNAYIARLCAGKAIDLTGQLNLMQLGALLKKTKLLVTNDSACLHLASYLDLPVVAIFGPTDEKKYGPWSGSCSIVKKDIACRPCMRAQCSYGTIECMSLIKPLDVLRQVRHLYWQKTSPPHRLNNSYLKRILIVRTDRIGDVTLSTPVIKALRDRYPDSYIAMMVSPYAKEIVEKNPFLDEVIIYDKEGKHKKWRRSIKFALNLKSKRFDLAVVLHPTNRAHLVTFFAGIKRRVGYNRKLGLLLTHKLRHDKHLGAKHELEYSLDMLRCLGIDINADEKRLFIPIKPESEEYISNLLEREGIKKNSLILAVNPSASCKSKMWPADRFSAVADKLADKYGMKVVIIAGPKDIKLAEQVTRNMKCPVYNLAGKTSVSQLASLLKRCVLFISNDSGPVHIATAVGTPVLSIFGRSQPGLGPKRWGPLGIRDRYIHKNVGCVTCLAHNCTRGFACLGAVTVDDVVSLSEEILKEGA
ncbi:MAG: lipopolysaccharide heptosyltransferase II [Candidatus Portnoybacteria bacterium]|nr:lipopolysaccharide heptosyltransferase II [Candidatus Portnoybacteria bacterium]